MLMETFTVARPADPTTEPPARILVFDGHRMRIVIACLIGTILIACVLAIGGVTANAVVGVLAGIAALSFREVVHHATHERRASRRG